MMLFRNLTMFRFAPFSLSIDSANEALGRRALRAIGPLEFSVTGFVPPLSIVDSLVYTASTLPFLVCFGTTEKILPNAVISEQLEKKIKLLKEREGGRIGAKLRKHLREEVLTDLLPRAFTKEQRLLAYLDTHAGWLVVNTASRKAAESMVCSLREAFGSFAAATLAPEESPRALMTHWISSGDMPAGFSFGDECELRDPADGGGKWLGRGVELQSDEAREHIRSGMQAFRIGLSYADRLSFSLGEDLSIRRLRFLDAAVDEITGETADDVFASEFALLCLEINALLAAMCHVFTIPTPTRAAP